MMKSKKNGALGLYIHIPFCVRKCGYCDFLSFPVGADAVSTAGGAAARNSFPFGKGAVSAYVCALSAEMQLWKYRMAGRTVDTVFVGGGTPTVLSAGELCSVTGAVFRCFEVAEDAEITVECNPGTADMEKLSCLRKSGVNRLSIGMQSAQDRELALLGRIHTFEDFLRCYHMARESGFDNINIDLMSAIPSQTVGSYGETLKKAVSLLPEHISSYSLMIEEGTPFYKKYRDTPPVDEDTDRMMYENTDTVLSEAGYTRYEISNYARAGRECRHNLKYWRREDYLGIGLGASSCLGHERFRNTADFYRYVLEVPAGKSPVEEREKLTEEEEQSEFMFLGLRCMDGVSAREFENCFSVSFERRYGEVTRNLAAQGLVEWEGGTVRLTKKGIDVSNRVFAMYL